MLTQNDMGADHCAYWTPIPCKSSVQVPSRLRVATFCFRAQSNGHNMTRIGFHLLLILTLALNGIAAPWAMGAAAHDSHSSHSAPEHSIAPAPGEAQQHGSEHHHDARLHSDTGDTDSAANNERDCCDGTSCECGCVLPHAMLFAGTQALPQVIATLPATVFYYRVSAPRNTPPFRPPAV